MSPEQKHDVDLGRLPAAFLDRLTRPFAQFLRIEAASGALLVLCTVAALILSNGPWSAQFVSAWEIRVGFQLGSVEFGRSLRDWINDGLMTLFFFPVAMTVPQPASPE